MRRLAAERQRCTAELERLTKRLVERAAALGDAAAQALPYLAKRASFEFRRESLSGAIHLQCSNREPEK